jgi:hypothetical protein
MLRPSPATNIPRVGPQPKSEVQREGREPTSLDLPPLTICGFFFSH